MKYCWTFNIGRWLWTSRISGVDATTTQELLIGSFFQISWITAESIEIGMNFYRLHNYDSNHLLNFLNARCKDIQTLLNLLVHRHLLRKDEKIVYMTMWNFSIIRTECFRNVWISVILAHIFQFDMFMLLMLMQWVSCHIIVITLSHVDSWWFICPPYVLYWSLPIARCTSLF